MRCVTVIALLAFVTKAYAELVVKHPATIEDKLVGKLVDKPDDKAPAPSRLSSIKRARLALSTFLRAGVDHVRSAPRRAQDYISDYFKDVPREQIAFYSGSFAIVALYVFAHTSAFPIDYAVEFISVMDEATKGLTAAVGPVLSNWYMMLTMSKMNGDWGGILMKTYVWTMIVSSVIASLKPILSRLMLKKLTKMMQALQQQKDAKLSQARQTQSAPPQAVPAMARSTPATKGPQTKAYSTPTETDIPAQTKTNSKPTDEEMPSQPKTQSTPTGEGVPPQQKQNTGRTGEDVCEGHGFDQAQCEDRKLCCVWHDDACWSAIGEGICQYYDKAAAGSR